MPHAARNNFERHISEPAEAIEVYNFLVQSGYRADFGLRFVWVSAISALDHFITELIVEVAVRRFDRKQSLPPSILAQLTPLSNALLMHQAESPAALVEFQRIVREMVKYRTFQKAKDVADGLSYIWPEKHKWKRIAEHIGAKDETVRTTLNNICYRRDLIVHNSDYNEATGNLTDCSVADAKTALEFICKIVAAIDALIID